ncbi:MAG: arginine--tRNA ligase [Acidobacteriota bacterium]|nr:arginine--tRNA ligase [Acidobacteriota bacterium]
MIDLYESLRGEIERAVRESVSPPPDVVPIEFPPDPELGDLATPVALSLARSLRKAPRAIAEELRERIERLPSVASAEVAGPGFVNVRIDRSAAVERLLAESDTAPASATSEKVIVEHTNINPNKAAHIGHLRNAVLGDTLVRLLSALGRTVEVQNYIDDTGVQVADVVVALLEMERLDEEGVAKLLERADARLADGGHGVDHDLWDLYASVTRWFEEDDTRLEHRARVLHELERGEGLAARVGRAVAAAVVACHLRTMERLGIRYDVLPKESDILSHSFWDAAFERLRDASAVTYKESGKTAGCWVMSLPHDEEGASAEEYEKIIVRSDGTVTYVGKDIAYQLWKFGLLGADFSFRPFAPFAYADGSRPMETAPPGSAPVTSPGFGRGRRVFNVIDTRQSYLQRVVREGLVRLGHVDEAQRSIHFSYEMVALSPETALQLRPDLRLTDEERRRPWLDMSGRRGLGVKADDLIDRLESEALREVEGRNPDLAREERETLAREIATGALRYYMLRFARTTVVAFDIDAALAFEGETGPYCQYASVRVARIVDKLAAALGSTRESLVERVRGARFDDIPAELASDHWRLVHLAARLPEVARQAVETLELATLARFAFELAQAINGFYHKYPVLQEPVEAVRDARLAVLLAADRALREGLSLLGVPLPRRM